jgi:hypothetical protein
MIEIIALILLTRQIGLKAKAKGLHTTRWKVYTLLAWIACELAGAVIAYILTGGVLKASVLFGLFAAFGGYLIVLYNINKYPDKPKDNWPNEIGG